jgi:DNA-binding beta-propeller fold protein YncE
VLDHPSLATPLPNGDFLMNDDDNDRVVVIDPRTNAIVWQYGVTQRPGGTPGPLNDPDGVDLVPPYSLDVTHAKRPGLP